MEVVATISTRLFCLSVELRTKNSSSIPASPWWVPLLPALLAALLHATVIRPLAVATRHCLNLKLEEASTCSSTWLRRVQSKVTKQVLRILLSEQTSLWLLYLLAPHLFDITVKLKVEIGTVQAMLHLLLNNTARLLLRLVTGLRVSTADADADAAAAADDDDDGRRQPGVRREREDGPRRSARHRRPSVRVAGPEWDKRLRG
jgi:hypothetical protein